MTKANVTSAPDHSPLQQSARAFIEPFRSFVRAQSGGGWALIVALVLALVTANSPWSERYYSLLELDITLEVEDEQLSMSLQRWVNDGLMALFFLLIGLELKRELLAGQLRDRRRAASIILAAIGGMIVPALVYLQIARAEDIRVGWAIPLATDTAFALTLLVLLRERIPRSARAFLVGVAIVDDLGAILVIALGYSADFTAGGMIPAAFVVLVLIAMNVSGVRSGLLYFLTGAVLWVLFMRAGIHGTLAGVVIASCAPVGSGVSLREVISRLKQNLRKLEKRSAKTSSVDIGTMDAQAIADDLSQTAARAVVPLWRWESRLEKPISFVVLPLFAFLNSGIPLTRGIMADAWPSPLVLAIGAALLLGKPLGIGCAIWLGRRIGVADLPVGLSWRHLIGLGMLGGVGFTMSLHFANLSFFNDPALLAMAKQGVLVSSLTAAVAGYLWLRWAATGRVARRRQRSGDRP